MSLSRWLQCYTQQHTNFRSVLWLLVALIACGIQFRLRSESIGVAPDGIIPGPTKSQLHDYLCLQKYGQVARDYYAASELTTDVALPIVYGTLAGIIFNLVFGSAGKRLLLLPLALVLADLTENLAFCCLALWINCETPAESIPDWILWCSPIKWSLAFLCVATAVIQLIRNALHRRAA